jgi:hypothetical protein
VGLRAGQNQDEPAAALVQTCRHAGCKVRLGGTVFRVMRRAMTESQNSGSTETNRHLAHALCTVRNTAMARPQCRIVEGVNVIAARLARRPRSAPMPSRRGLLVPHASGPDLD